MNAPPSGPPPSGPPPSGPGGPMDMRPPMMMGMPPGGMPPMHGMPPFGMPPFGLPPGGMPPQGMPGMPPHGMPQQGMPGMPPPPQGMPPQDAAPSMPNSALPPNPSLYVNNLNEKLKIDELKKALFHVFSQFGPIVEISAYKDLKRRGQAWIVFEAVGSSTKALNEMANFSFYGKPMQVSYARTSSDVVSKKGGTFVPRPLRKQQKKKRGGVKKKKEKKEKKEKKPKTEPIADGEEPSTAATVKEESSDLPPPPPAQSLPAAAPNRILFVENLPIKCTDDMLTMLFAPYPGFKEARLVNGRPGIAFVEFEDHSQSGVAKQALHNFKITPTNNMKVTFARQ